MLKNHEVFQGYYYLHHFGADRNLRDRFKTEPYYDELVRWCHLYDQRSFDPSYPHLSMEFFLPIVSAVLGREAYWWDPSHPHKHVVTGSSTKIVTV